MSGNTSSVVTDTLQLDEEVVKPTITPEPKVEQKLVKTSASMQMLMDANPELKRCMELADRQSCAIDNIMQSQNEELHNSVVGLFGEIAKGVSRHKKVVANAGGFVGDMTGMPFGGVAGEFAGNVAGGFADSKVESMNAEFERRGQIANAYLPNVQSVQNECKELLNVAKDLYAKAADAYTDPLQPGLAPLLLKTTMRLYTRIVYIYRTAGSIAEVYNAWLNKTDKELIEAKEEVLFEQLLNGWKNTQVFPKYVRSKERSWPANCVLAIQDPFISKLIFGTKSKSGLKYEQVKNAALPQVNKNINGNAYFYVRKQLAELKPESVSMAFPIVFGIISVVLAVIIPWSFPTIIGVFGMIGALLISGGANSSFKRQTEACDKFLEIAEKKITLNSNNSELSKSVLKLKRKLEDPPFYVTSWYYAGFALLVSGFCLASAEFIFGILLFIATIVIVVAGVAHKSVNVISEIFSDEV